MRRLWALVIGACLLASLALHAQSIPTLADQIKALADQIKVLSTPVPLACQVSPFTFQSATDWTPVPCPTSGQQVRQETWVRTTITPPANGGTPCPALTEIRAGMQACTPPPPSGSGFVVRDATNTGLAGAGITEASLTPQGATTYSSANNGQTVTGKRFTGQVTITTAMNLTFDGCLFERAGGANQNLVVLNSGASQVTIKNSTFRSSTAGGFYNAIQQNGTVAGLTIESNNIANATNLISLNDRNTNTRIANNYLHDSRADQSSAHLDGIEVYGGANVTIEGNTITFVEGPTAAINIAPWSGSNTVTDLTIQDNYIDGGQGHFTIDAQVANPLTAILRTRLLRNRFGGHGGGGAYSPYLVGIIYESRSIVTTDTAQTATPSAILLPATGPDVNLFYYAVNNPFGYRNLSPDRTGQLVTAAFFISGG